MNWEGDLTEAERADRPCSECGGWTEDIDGGPCSACWDQAT